MPLSLTYRVPMKNSQQNGIPIKIKNIGSQLRPNSKKSHKPTMSSLTETKEPTMMNYLQENITSKMQAPPSRDFSINMVHRENKNRNSSRSITLIHS